MNTCLSEAIQNVKLLDAAQNELTLITGQKAVITKARKSVSQIARRYAFGRKSYVAWR